MLVCVQNEKKNGVILLISFLFTSLPTSYAFNRMRLLFSNYQHVIVVRTIHKFRVASNLCNYHNSHINDPLMILG